MKLRLSELRSIIADEVSRALLEAHGLMSDDELDRRAQVAGVEGDSARKWEEQQAVAPDEYITAVLTAGDPGALRKAKGAWLKAADAGLPVPGDGKFMYFHDNRASELKALGSSPQVRGRTDALLRTRDSSGRATPRKW